MVDRQYYEDVMILGRANSIRACSHDLASTKKLLLRSTCPSNLLLSLLPGNNFEIFLDCGSSCDAVNGKTPSLSANPSNGGFFSFAPRRVNHQLSSNKLYYRIWGSSAQVDQSYIQDIILRSVDALPGREGCPWGQTADTRLPRGRASLIGEMPRYLVWCGVHMQVRGSVPCEG